VTSRPSDRGLAAALRFWGRLTVETLGGRRLDRVVAARLGAAPITATGAGDLPPDGPFVFAVNHFRAGLTMGTVSAVISAAACARPDVARDTLLIVGGPPRPPTGRLVRVVRRLMSAFWARWSRAVLRVPMAGNGPTLSALRAFREAARERPVLVFPEGRASALFADVRPGAGRWLGSLAVPVVPVGVFRSDDGWTVAFGPPLRWSPRAELRDVQLGLAIASLLPPALAPRWLPLLERWRAAHSC